MQTVELRRADLPLVFAIVREEFPQLGLDQWLTVSSAFVDRELYGESRGIVAACTVQTRYRGLFLYTVETTLDHGQTLTLPHVIVPQLPDRGRILESLLGAALDLAQRHECRAVRSTVPTPMAEDVMSFLGSRAQISGLALSFAVAPSGRRRSALADPLAP